MSEIEINPAGWFFKCDSCGKAAHCAAPNKIHAREDAEDAGWQFLPRRDLCPNCKIKPEQLIAPVQEGGGE